METSSPNALSQLKTALERLNLPFVIGGSVASSSHGIARSTLDVDLVVAIGVNKADALAMALGRDWYADPEYIRDSLRLGRSFNLVHLPTSRKFDLFPAVEEFHACQLERAEKRNVDYDGESVLCPVATAEDILLAKLRWYRDGGQVSERQWTDIHGILAINPDLDFTYVNHWAARLRVADLLARALSERKAGS